MHVGPLTKPEFAVLDACRDARPRSQRVLADQTHLSLGYVNQTLRRLRDSGLLSGLTITPAGWEALEPYKVTNAIILAAGAATRFAPVSYERPKGLLVVKGEVLIERQIRQLQTAGITNITIVVGYHQEQFLYLEDTFGVHILINPAYTERNNNSSLKAAETLLDNTYICSCDNYFTHNVFEPYAYQGYYAAVWQEGTSNEWALTTTPTGRITAATPGATHTWIMMGHAYWDRAFSLRFRAILDAAYDHPDTPPKLWEAIYADHITELTLHIRTYPDNTIKEFDTLDDLRAFDPDFVTNIDSTILDNISATLNCQPGEPTNFQLIPEGLTNLSFRFTLAGHDYVYRHPGLATQGILNRAAEAQAETIAATLGLDETFIYLDPTTGWKVSHYLPTTQPFDYHNPTHIHAAMTALRTLHTQPHTIDNHSDLYTEATGLCQRLSGNHHTTNTGRLGFPDFTILNNQARQLNTLCHNDHWPTVLCHNDFYAPNILINGDHLALIDWEYAGMGDPASDLGTFICCSDDTWDQALNVFTTYFQHTPTPTELRHCVAHVGLTAFYWWIWALYKDACGEPVGEWTYRWYRRAKEYGTRALTLYTTTPTTPTPPTPQTTTTNPNNGNMTAIRMPPQTQRIPTLARSGQGSAFPPARARIPAESYART